MKKHRYVKKRSLIGTIHIILCLVLLTGCWSSHEANDLAIMNVMTIDKDDGGQFELTALIANSQNSLSSLKKSSAQDLQNLPRIETGTGRSLLEALSKLAATTSKQIYLGHVDVVIFGEKTASESMEESLDWLRREGGFRPNIQLLVTKGKASDIIKTRTQLETPLGSEIQNLIKSKQLTSTNMVHDLSKFTGTLSTNMKDSITGEISFAREKGIKVEEEVSGKAKSEEDEKQKNNSDALNIQGTAVFKKAQLIGWLNKQETRGVLWVTGKLKNDVIVLNCPRDEVRTISLRIMNTDSSLSPHLIKGKPEIDVNIKLEGEIGQISCPNFKLNTEQIDELNGQLTKIVKQEVDSTFAKAKLDWQTDIFGFGESIYRKYPDEWKKISSNWRDGGLKELTVHVNVSANISRFGQREKPGI